ncbi:outer membrane protein [Nitratireductor indicus]|uniref:outer membrane protein n=1 Tax=Nitratireductor indicus TaxID=721133 RepID=UPI002875EB37|nr:porin family protein [Nitratireductor indicus]MDS1135995.1 porin family protein [Nitratireductor indicus]
MNRILVAVAATFVFSHAANAADMIVNADPAAIAPIELDVFDWSGPYIGGHLGYGWGKHHDNMPPAAGDKPPLGIPLAVKDRSGTFVGGIHAGYNWQDGPFVYGVEGDFDYTNLERGRFFYTTPEGSNSSAQGSLHMETDWQASLRLRAGIASGTWLFYGTGGVAFGRAKLSVTGNPLPPGAPDPVLASDRNTHIGWTAGAGIEKAFTSHWIGRVEARYTDFGSKTYNLGRFGEKVKSHWDQATISVGLSYKF